MQGQSLAFKLTVFPIGLLILVLWVPAMILGLIAKDAHWAVYGNDDDGIYGEGSGEAGYDPQFHPSYHPLIQPIWWRRVRWWCRNPMHNLFFKVLRWPGGPMFSCRWFYIGFRPNSGDLAWKDGVWGAAGGRPYGGY